MNGMTTRIRVAGDECLAAVRWYVAELSRRVGAGADLTVESDPDVVFEGTGAERQEVRIDWTFPATDAGEWEEEAETGSDLSRRIEPYLGTIAALGENRAAAAAILGDGGKKRSRRRSA